MDALKLYRVIIKRHHYHVYAYSKFEVWRELRGTATSVIWVPDTAENRAVPHLSLHYRNP